MAGRPPAASMRIFAPVLDELIFSVSERTVPRETLVPTCQVSPDPYSSFDWTVHTSEISGLVCRNTSAIINFKTLAGLSGELLSLLDATVSPPTCFTRTDYRPYLLAMGAMFKVVAEPGEQAQPVLPLGVPLPLYLSIICWAL